MTLTTPIRVKLSTGARSLIGEDLRARLVSNVHRLLEHVLRSDIGLEEIELQSPLALTLKGITRSIWTVAFTAGSSYHNRTYDAQVSHGWPGMTNEDVAHAIAQHLGEQIHREVGRL